MIVRAEADNTNPDAPSDIIETLIFFIVLHFFLKYSREMNFQ
jgi:hypothetical protein